MVDWSSEAELAVDADAFTKLMHCLAGVYFWEFAVSLEFDWAFLAGKKQFNWRLIFYWLGRYCLFFAMIGILTALDVTSEINCQALYTFNQLAGDAAVGLASINLSLRTMAIWSQNRYIVILLVIVILGHWALILQGRSSNTILAATFIYSMCFDALVMTLSALKLAPRAGHSQLIRLLFKDGLIYFLVAFIANLIATVFMLLDLNSVMSVVFNVPAAVASTIVASRAVRRLSKFTPNGAQVYSSTSGGFHTAANPAASHHTYNHPMGPKSLSGGVHVQMQTFAVADEGSPYGVPDVESRKIGDIESGEDAASDIKPQVL
ncbi:hypothetical protein SCP_0508980 [Sparassis crispa]|uniref:Transmembrane protein n=1 Tax=Sparassis crispa TaxID=139825 RepID=A0A401GNM6_9APHY|nr:hypothetical protein SCP_0508980 [Sparassis crispa]GBE83841.1 hypothetical protein SCP_0508980 [Sparassis crispa]